MKITHYCNSFIAIESDGFLLITDPWTGHANYGSWISIPVVEDSVLLELFNKSDAIYISHLHSDHFDEYLLKKFANKSTPVYIKKFKNNRLCNRIKNIGFKTVNELNDWENYKVGDDLTITIIPQLESNSAGLKDDLNYDLDTSLLVYSHSSEKVFFHKVDNPLSIESLKLVSKYSKENFNTTPNVATLTCGAASEWPQCFPKFDRLKLKNEFIKSSLLKFKECASALGCKYIIPGGGRYAISGRFAGLNNFLAVANHSQMNSILGQSANLLSIEGGGSIQLNAQGVIVKETSEPSIDSQFLESLYSKKYDYEKLDIDFKNDDFVTSKQEWQDKLKKMQLHIESSIYFRVYDRLKIDMDGLVNNYNDGNSQSLCLIDIGKDMPINEIHIEESALAACMKKGYILKQVMSGSLTIQNRKPDVFYPASMFSLAFF